MSWEYRRYHQCCPPSCRWGNRTRAGAGRSLSWRGSVRHEWTTSPTYSCRSTEGRSQSTRGHFIWMANRVQAAGHVTILAYKNCELWTFLWQANSVIWMSTDPKYCHAAKNDHKFIAMVCTTLNITYLNGLLYVFTMDTNRYPHQHVLWSLSNWEVGRGSVCVTSFYQIPFLLILRR